MQLALATFPMIMRNVEDLKRPWKNRGRVDQEATRAIELAYLRGYQAGIEDAQTKKRKNTSTNTRERRD